MKKTPLTLVQDALHGAQPSVTLELRNQALEEELNALRRESQSLAMELQSYLDPENSKASRSSLSVFTNALKEVLVQNPAQRRVILTHADLEALSPALRILSSPSLSFGRNFEGASVPELHFLKSFANRPEHYFFEEMLEALGHAPDTLQKLNREEAQIQSSQQPSRWAWLNPWRLGQKIKNALTLPKDWEQHQEGDKTLVANARPWISVWGIGLVPTWEEEKARTRILIRNFKNSIFNPFSPEDLQRWEKISTAVKSIWKTSDSNSQQVPTLDLIQQKKQNLFEQLEPARFQAIHTADSQVGGWIQRHRDRMMQALERSTLPENHALAPLLHIAQQAGQLLQKEEALVTQRSRFPWLPHSSRASVMDELILATRKQPPLIQKRRQKELAA